MHTRILFGAAVLTLSLGTAACQSGGDAEAETNEPTETEGSAEAGDEATGEGDETETEPAADGDEGAEADNDSAEGDDVDPTATPEDVAAPPENAETTASGLASVVLRAGTGGVRPGPTDTVQVHYAGWTTDGELFDASYNRGEPTSFPLNAVIAGWTEGLQLMEVGEKRRFWIPENLAYGGRPGRPAGMLVFDVELLDVLRPPEAPADVAAPPANAEVTESGLASVVLEAGDGTEHPTATSRVTVHYTGWTTDGEMFDSSISRGQPATFGLNQVIAGWTEGLQLMVTGETRRLWIPEDLAYGGRPGRPAGMLVFDVQLLAIQ